MLAPETVLQGRYSVVKQLGQGGMGAVYLARDNRFQGRSVALKETLVDRSRHDLRKQFEREALLLFDLKHQALPKVIDYFSEGQGEFLVMEYVEGMDLSEVLARNGGPFGIKQVVSWAEQLLDALEYLHGLDPPVIHRDIKPSNVKLTPKGRVVLLDFGLAKGALMAQSRMLSGSVVAGTPAYAPLEQMNGQGTDPRSDLYSLAATMYTMLSNRLPADAGMRATEILNSNHYPLVSLQELVPGISESMWWTLRSTLSVAKDGRPRSATELRAALRAALEEIPGEGARATVMSGIPATPRPTEFAGGAQNSAPHQPQQTAAHPPGSSSTEGESQRVTTPRQFQSTEPLTSPRSASIAPPPTPSAPPPPVISSQPAPVSQAPVQQAPAYVVSAPVAAQPERIASAPGPTAVAQTPKSSNGLWITLILVATLVVGVGAFSVYYFMLKPETAVSQPPVEPAKPTVAPAPAPAPAAPAAPIVKYVDAVAWQIERPNGSPIDISEGPVATGEEFRFRFSTPVAGRVSLLAPDAKGTYRAYLTDKPSADTSMKSNVVGLGKPIVFPGPPLTLSVAEGETRFLAVVAPDGEVVPEPLRGAALAAVDAADIDALKESAREVAGSTETESVKGNVTVKRVEGQRGILVFEITIVGRSGGRR